MISPQYVKPFVKTNKNDRNDAEAICEAAVRPSMRFVPPKSVEQQDVFMMHRIRQRRVQRRTALTNQIRGLLLEYGVSIPVGICRLRRQIPAILEDATNELSDLARELLAELRDELLTVEEQIKSIDRRIDIVFRQSERCQRLAQIPGVGPLTATALEAAVGNGSEFRNGRHMAAWLGLVPRQSRTPALLVLRMQATDACGCDKLGVFDDSLTVCPCALPNTRHSNRPENDEFYLCVGLHQNARIGDESGEHSENGAARIRTCSNRQRLSQLVGLVGSQVPPRLDLLD